MFICDISIFNRYGKQRLDEMLSVLGVDWRILVAILVIHQMPGIPQGYLGRFLQTDKGNVTKILKQMEKEEWIGRETDLIDHRTKKCTLLDKGEALVPKLQTIMKVWEEKCFSDFDETELASYRRMNEKITQNLLKNWCIETENKDE